MSRISPFTKEILQNMVQVIVNEVEPVRIILFGSHAKGNSKPDSDVDFLVIEKTSFGKERSRRKDAARLWKALAHFRIPKDILDFPKEVQMGKNNTNHVVGEAIREGKVLYDAHG